MVLCTNTSDSTRNILPRNKEKVIENYEKALSGSKINGKDQSNAKMSGDREENIVTDKLRSERRESNQDRVKSKKKRKMKSQDKTEDHTDSNHSMNQESVGIKVDKST